jgi:hypothetical protein
MTAQWSYVGQQTVLPGHSTKSVKVCPSKLQVPLDWSEPPLQPKASKHAAKARAIFMRKRCVASALLASGPLGVPLAIFRGRAGKAANFERREHRGSQRDTRPLGHVQALPEHFRGENSERSARYTSLRRRGQFLHCALDGGHQCCRDQRALDGQDNGAPEHHRHRLRCDQCDRPDIGPRQSRD